jgi:hypothetical protein
MIDMTTESPYADPFLLHLAAKDLRYGFPYLPTNIANQVFDKYDLSRDFIVSTYMTIREKGFFMMDTRLREDYRRIIEGWCMALDLREGLTKSYILEEGNYSSDPSGYVEPAFGIPAPEYVRDL